MALLSAPLAPLAVAVPFLASATTVYERVYDSAWHHPLLCWLAAPFILAALVSTHDRHSDPFQLRFALAWLVMIALDALWTGSFPPLAPAHPMTQVLAVLFVILGDLRYFQLVETLAPPGDRLTSTRGAFLRGVLWSLVVPVSSTAVRLLLPSLFSAKRAMFLLYESLFCVLLVFILIWLLPRRLRRTAAGDPQRELRLHALRLLTVFELAQYALWVLCDALILGGVPQALLLRIVPNFLYYVVFVPFAYFAVPAAVRLPWSDPDTEPPSRRRVWARRLGLATALLLVAGHGVLLWLKLAEPVPVLPPATPVAAPGPPEPAGAVLRFVAPGSPRRELDLAALRRIAPVERVTAYDPYYGRTKSFDALPIEPLLAHAFSLPAVALRSRELMLRGRDGYSVPLPGARLLEEGAGAYLAFDDPGGWEPIGPQRADPRPFYLIWKKPEQQNLVTHPRPFQLVEIELLSREQAARLFPRAVPRVNSDTPAGRGFLLFLSRCIACHAINRDGGRVGPDLNVPQNILEYRPVEQVRAYIRDPRSFRYGNMPSHRDLADEQLDELVAYLKAMQAQKEDPDAARPSPPAHGDPSDHGGAPQ